MAFVDAADPGVKAASKALLADAARRAETHERALAARVSELEAAGLPVQVPVLEARR
jgi:hypothetical protein